MQATSLYVQRPLVRGNPLRPLKHQLERRTKMIAFIVGTMVGGMYGVFIMCLLQISRDERWDECP